MFVNPRMDFGVKFFRFRLQRLRDELFASIAAGFALEQTQALCKKTSSAEPS